MMRKIAIIKHAKGAPGLRLLGLGPNLIPRNGLKKLQLLFNQNAFWAKNRHTHQIKKMLRHSSVIVTIWSKANLIGFGRATTDKVFRAALWDIVISKKSQRLGLGKLIIETLLNDKDIKSVERVYLMTTHGKEFYIQLGFQENTQQSLLMLNARSKQIIN
tara:strand:- start:240 stop:719 length:480 start_codon:yes stop_codon:yes gene_type:complete